MTELVRGAARHRALGGRVWKENEAIPKPDRSVYTKRS